MSPPTIKLIMDENPPWKIFPHGWLLAVPHNLFCLDKIIQSPSLCAACSFAVAGVFTFLTVSSRAHNIVGILSN